MLKDSIPPPYVVASAAIVAATVSLSPNMAQAAGGVLSTNTEIRRVVATDSTAILQHALPIAQELRGEESPPIRTVQFELERIALSTRSRTGVARKLNARASMLRINSILNERRLDLLLDVPGIRRADAAVALARLDKSVAAMEGALGLSDAPKSTLFPTRVVAFAGALADSFDSDSDSSFDSDSLEMAEVARKSAIEAVGEIEEMMVDTLPFPYRIPRRYESLPRLLGRATVELNISKGDKKEWRGPNGKSLGSETKMKVVLDGYSAPLTAGNFVDLVQTGAYNDASILGAQRGFCIRVGKKGGGSESAKRRRVPIEILVEGERMPVYGSTLDDAGLGDLQPALPVTAYGAVAMEQSAEDPNDAATEWDIFEIDPRSYTARALRGSVLTGSVATFGYVTDGAEKIGQIEAGDTIRSARIIRGADRYSAHG